MKIVLAGRYGIGVRALEFLRSAGHVVLAIVAAPSDLERTWQPSLADAGRAAGLPVLITNINDAVPQIRALGPDVVLSLQHPDLFKREILALPPAGCINLHYGRLPEYGGCYPIIWPILNGEDEAGATLHYMDEQFDSGAIIGIESVRIGANETGRQLYDRVADAAFDLLRREMPRISTGSVQARPQAAGAGRYYRKDSIDFGRERFVDWRQPAATVHNRVRAFTFPPFQRPALRSATGALECWDSAIVPGANAPPGTVLGIADGRLLIATLQGIIGLRSFRSENQTLLEADAVLGDGLLTVGQRLS